MKKKIIQSVLIIVLAIFSSCTNEKITLESLLQEMTDREVLTNFPAPSYTVKQFSSYDQRSISADQEGWFANSDYTQFIREETNNGRREFVLFDDNGPGALVRCWMTFAGPGASEGILRIYIDYESQPVVEDSVLKVLSGGLLAEEPLSTSVSPETDYQRRGHNLYLPLPYAKHCKITYECDSVKIENNHRKPSVYYNINYRTYKKGTLVESFSGEILDRAASAIKNTTENLKNPEIDISQTKRFPKSKILHPGDTLIFNIESENQAIRKLLINLDAIDTNQALRSTVLSISFDNNQTVWCPVGDFFGTGYQICKSKTWYSEVSEKGLMISRWVMPFHEKCLVKIINYGSQRINLDAAVHISDYEWNRSSMYFGTSWHEYHHLNSWLPEEKQLDSRHFDVNYVTLEGKGLYAGDALTVFNTADAWWGEGDEKIFVDNDIFPSCIGTGTEDYYGYAWCRPETFSHPFIAQPSGNGNFHPGMTVNMRYRSLDAMPFNHKIKSDIEMWHWAETKINFAMTSYWYVKPGFSSNIKPEPEIVKKQVDLKRTDIYPSVVNDQGVIENEWIQLFNGKDLSGWDIKISGFELNDNYKNTFRVEDGILKASYNRYENFNGEFGHLITREKFSSYILRVEYRFVGEQIPGGPGWGIFNNGAMLHSQSAESMLLDQDFPVSIEAQFLGGYGEDERTTSNVCTPGTNIVMNGELITNHCTGSSSKTYPANEWVTAEMIVLGDSIIHHVLEEDTVLTYTKPQIGGELPEGFPLAEGTLLKEGHIAIQAESHSTEFRKIELLDLGKK